MSQCHCYHQKIIKVQHQTIPYNLQLITALLENNRNDNSLNFTIKINSNKPSKKRLPDNRRKEKQEMIKIMIKMLIGCTHKK